MLRKRRGRCKIPLPGFFFNDRLLLFSFCSFLSSLIRWSWFCLFLPTRSLEMFISWGSSKYCFQLAWHRLTTWLLCWLCQSLLWSFHKDKDQGEWIVKEIIYNLTGFLFKRRPSRARRCWGIEAGVQKRQLPCFTIFTFLSWCLVHLKGQHVAEISVFKMVHYFHCQYDVVLLMLQQWMNIG